MFFSIVTVCKNDLKGLEKTVLCVRKQTCSDYEHVIVDGGSEDGTAEYIKDLETGNCIAISEPDNGISDAFNKGLRFARGEYVVFLNSGDTIVSEISLEKIKNEISDGCDIEIYSSNLGTHTLPPQTGEAFFSKYWSTAMIPHQSSFVKRKVFDSIGNFDINLYLRMDYDFFFRCVKNGVSHRYHPTPFANYAHGGACHNNPIWFYVEGADVFHRHEKKESDEKYQVVIRSKKLRIDKDTIYLISYFGLGDTMILASLRDEIEKKYEGHVCYIVKESHVDILKMYDISDYQIASFTLDEAAEIACRCLKPTKGALFVAHPKFNHDAAANAFESGSITFTDMYKRFLDLSMDAWHQEADYPTELSEHAKSILRGKNIEEMILIAPELTSYSYDKILHHFFECIMEVLEKKGETYIINCVNDSFDKYREAIVSTLSIQDILVIAQRCKRVISARSGLCDLLYHHVKDMIVVYPDLHFRNCYGLNRTYGVDLRVMEYAIRWSDGLKKAGVENCAIYGIGSVGEALRKNFEMEGFHISFMIDQNAHRINYDIPIYTPDDELPEADMIVVTVRKNADRVVSDVYEKTGVKTVYYTELYLHNQTIIARIGSNGSFGG